MSYSNTRKKQRNEKRNFKMLKTAMEDFYPYEDFDCDYESFLVPMPSSFLDKSATEKKVKTSFMRAWVNKSKLFIECKPKEIAFCKVFSVVTYPDLSSSQIYIFYNKESYHNFWIDKTKNNIWHEIKDTSFNKLRHITTQNERGYFEIVETDSGRKYKEQLWFYGDIE